MRLWLSSLNSGQSTDVIYIDFAKAFDTVSHPKLLHKLKSYGILGKLLQWITAWLTGRSQSVKLGDIYSSFKAVLSGVFQGSVLGPLLFLIFINDLPDNISPDANPTLFADDLKLSSDQKNIQVSSSPLHVFCPILQTSLDSIHAWSILWQLHISIPKCSTLSISNVKSHKPRLYSINSHPLPQVTSCSDLGVIIDNKLTFSNHILSITKKAYIQSLLLSRCFLSKNANLLQRAFTSFVRPTLEYASPIWSPHLTKDILLLEKVQRRFTKSIRSIHSLPYESRLDKLKLDTLSLRRTNIDLCTCYRIIHHLTPLDPSHFFTPRNTITRGHPFSLVKPPVRLDSSKFAFQSRTIDPWNSLPLTVVASESVAVFKFKLKCLNLPV